MESQSLGLAEEILVVAKHAHGTHSIPRLGELMESALATRVPARHQGYDCKR